MVRNLGLLDRFRRGPELVATALTGAAGAELDFVPAPGKWSVRQIAAHLADAEVVLATRFRFIIAEEVPTLMAFDQEAWAAHLNYDKRKTSDSLDTFRRTRLETYELLKDLPPEAFSRLGNHSQRGLITLEQLMELGAAHAEGHARQIREVRDRFKEARLQQRAAEG